MEKTNKKNPFIVCGLHQPLASSICSFMDTNTSIMYEGSAVSQYSTWELHCSWAGKDKSSKSSVSVEILTHPTGLHHSVICWMFSKKVTAFDGLARVFHVFWDYIFLFLFFVIVLLYDKDKQMHWVSFMLDLCCVYGVRHFQYWNFLFSADDALYFLKTLCESVNISNQITPIRSKIKNSTESAGALWCQAYTVYMLIGC